MSQNLSTSGGWRVALRLARREALRRKGQTALMLVLICLPVLAVTAASIVWRTQDVSGAESVERRMGTADALVETSGLDAVAQAFDPEGSYTSIGDTIDEDAILDADDLDAVLAVIGPDRPVTTLVDEALTFRTDRGFADLQAIATDLANPITDGLMKPVSGQYPPGPGEVVVNQALVDRGPGIGDTLTVIRKTPDGEQELELEIVGVAEHAANRGLPYAAALPGAFGKGYDDAIGRWLVGGGRVSWDDVRALNEIGVLATSRQVLTDPPPESELDPVAVLNEPAIDDVTLTVLALVVAMVLMEVVLLAGPAFAVRAKSQAHALALVAAAGGTPRQSRRTVLASGVLIGAVGGVLGVALGLVTGAAAVPIAQRFNSTTFGPFEVPWLLLLVVAGFGFVSAVLAALVPAFSASRQNVVAVLAGRRGEGRPSVRSPIAGLVLIGLGITGALLGVGGGSNGLAPGLIGGSAIVSVLGMILFVPVAVSLVSRLAARLPLALRFAARDAARHRTRTVPAVAAVGATVAGVVALGIAISSQQAADEERYQAQLPPGYAAVALDSTLDRKAIDDVLSENLSGTTITSVMGVQANLDGDWLETTYRADDQDIQNSTWGTLGTRELVGTEVPEFVGLSAEERRRADDVLAQGGAVLLRGADDSDRSGPVQVDGVTVTVNRYPEDGGEPQVEVEQDVAATMVEVSGLAPAVAVLPPTLAKQLGLPVSETALLIHPTITGEQQKDIEESFAALSEPVYSFYVERGFQPDAAVRIIQFVLAALGGILMLGGTLTATFLALSDARPDLATMSAVGARPRTRRSVAASYALVVGAVGAILGAPIGFIPGVAVSQPLTRHYFTGDTSLDVPWLLIVSVVVGLPLLTAAAVGVCARGRLPLTARVD
ncbi:MAG: hypothetical protein NTX33_01705 [Propionibacteriales bacterium]|nr:hypothetical protein [Propionibacteriales bacterium]